MCTICGILSRHTLITGFIISAALLPSFAFAQAHGEDTMQGDDHTAREEAEGRGLWGKLQREEADCDDLSDDEFAALGEFFMGEMTGDAHEAMNAMMTRMMGERGEEEMHAAMGKRMSGCRGDATLPMGGDAGMMMPMMGMMMGDGMMGRSRTGADSWNGASPLMGGWSNSHDSATMFPMTGYGLGAFGFLPMLLWWTLIIVAIVALVKWLMGQGKTGKRSSPLDILKERYARGEIDRKEFEERKKDLS